MVNRTDTFQSLEEKIKTYLDKGGVQYLIVDGHYVVNYRSTHIVIHPIQQPDYAILHLYVPVAIEISRITPELTAFIAEKNSELPFGKFSLNKNEKIVLYGYSVLGDFVDYDELFFVLGQIANTANKYHKSISLLAGGKQVLDLRSEIISLLKRTQEVLKKRPQEVLKSGAPHTGVSSSPIRTT